MPFIPADSILAPTDSEFYIALEGTQEEKERLDKLMQELLNEEPLFDDSKKYKDAVSIQDEKKPYWWLDKYKLYQPSYECTWNDQNYVGNLD